jgi:hypothetical protein
MAIKATSFVAKKDKGDTNSVSFIYLISSLHRPKGKGMKAKSFNGTVL